jgi:hypothetical protein
MTLCKDDMHKRNELMEDLLKKKDIRDKGQQELEAPEHHPIFFPQKHYLH